MERMSAGKMLMEMAWLVAKRGTCDRRQVGCVLATPEGRVLAVGYNGAPEGCPHCSEAGHLMYRGSCLRAVHAEVNAVGFAARRGGPPLDGAVAFVTTHPCPSCLLLLITAGVRVVRYAEPYHEDADEISKILASGKIDAIHFTGRD